LATEQAKTAKLLEQFSNKNLTDKEKAFELEKEAKKLQDAVNDKGLSEIDREKKLQEAIKKTTELRTLQAKIRKDDKSESERKETEEKKYQSEKKKISEEIDTVTTRGNDEKNRITVSAPQAADRYARMGLFTGGQVNNQPVMLAERQLKETQITNRILTEMTRINERLQQVEENHNAWLKHEENKG